MQTIICATYPEADPLIRHLKLKKTNIMQQKAYINTTGNITLFLSGVGKENAINKTKKICKIFNKNLQLINIGTCACIDNERIILGCKLSTNDKKANLYPDILINCKNICNLKEIITCDNIATSDMVKNNQNLCFDMEAYYIFKTASRYIGPHQISFVKIAHDKGIDCRQKKIYKTTANNNDCSIKDSLSKCISNNIENIIYIIDLLKGQIQSIDNDLTLKNYKKNGSITKDIYLSVEKFAQKLNCSVCMKSRLKNQFTYAQLLGIDIDEMTNKILSDIDFPIEHKKTCIKILDKIDTYLNEQL